MKTYLIANEQGEPIECIEVNREVLRRYYGNQTTDICSTCPAYRTNDNPEGFNCARLGEGTKLGCPVAEILVPLTETRTAAFVAAILEE